MERKYISEFEIQLEKQVATSAFAGTKLKMNLERSIEAGHDTYKYKPDHEDLFSHQATKQNI